MGKFEADQRLRALLRQPCLFDPDVAELAACAAALGRRLRLRRVDFVSGAAVEYVIGAGVDGAENVKTA